MKATIYTPEGKEHGSAELSPAVFGLTWNADLVHDVVVAMQANARAGTAHTKDRSEVSGGGKKPWRQKGTGRARHGSRRSPIWAGGGVSHGPRTEKDYSVKINKKTRAKALGTVLSKKLADAEVILVSAIEMAEPKTATIKAMLSDLAKGSGNTTLATKRKNAAVVVLPTRDLAVEKSVRNFGNITVIQAKDINPVDVLTYKYVVIVNPSESLAVLETRVAGTSNQS